MRLGKYIFITASAAAALSVPQDTASYFHLVHGCHYSCECGPPRGFGCEQQYHRHLHMLCLPFAATDTLTANGRRLRGRAVT